MATPVPTVAPKGFESFYPYPESVFALSPAQHLGLLPLGALACISVLSTASLICYLTYEMIKSFKSRDVPGHRNQLLVLVYNLLWADLWQAFSFLFSFHWQHINMVLAPTNPCWTQAWFLHLGDVASGGFVLAIALHTWHKIIMRFNAQISHRTFVISIFGIWGFAVLMASLAPIMRGSDAFVRAGSWVRNNRTYFSTSGD